MNTPLGKQSIRCSVKSCCYHSNAQNACELDAIQVAARRGDSSTTPEGESMCASYKHG